MSKTVNGNNEGTFTSLDVSPDDSIVQDLTVNGTLTASGVAVSTLTGAYYTASDSNYQYRFDSGTMDLKSTSSGAPTVRLLNNVNTVESTTLQTGLVTAVTNQSTVQYTSQQNSGTGTSGGAGFKAINDSSNSIEMTMRSSNHSSKPNHADIVALDSTQFHISTNNSADISIRTNATERVNIANSLVTVKQPISETDTTESSSTSTGSIVTAGGLGVAKNITVGGQVGIGSSPAVSLDLSSKTDALRLSNGTTAQRPTGANGQLRYNTTNNTVEAYSNSAWTAVTSGPYFVANRSSTQALTGGFAADKIQFNSITNNVRSCYDATTNYRFTPDIPGFYTINACCEFAKNLGLTHIFIRKNGTLIAQNSTPSDVNYTSFCSVTCGTYMNGSTDYVEGFAAVQTAGNLLGNAVFSGSWVQG